MTSRDEVIVAIFSFLLDEPQVTSITSLYIRAIGNS